MPRVVTVAPFWSVALVDAALPPLLPAIPSRSACIVAGEPTNSSSGKRVAYFSMSE